MAQFYHVIDWEGLSVQKQAALVYGLPAHSRTKARIRGGRELSTEDTLLAVIADNLTTLVWFQSEDAQRGNNRPSSILSALLGEAEADDDVEVFDSPEEFEKERERLLNRKDEEE